MSHRYGFIVRDADDVIEDVWLGPSRGLSPSAGRTFVFVPKDKYSLVAGKTRHDGDPNGWRWKWQANDCVEQPDTRPITRWIADPDGTPASTHDGPVEYSLDVGDPAGKVRIEVVDELGQIRTNIGTAQNPVVRRIPVGPYQVRVSVVAGVAELNVPTTRSRQATVTSNADFKLLNPLKLSVVDTEL